MPDLVICICHWKIKICSPPRFAAFWEIQSTIFILYVLYTLGILFLKFDFTTIVYLIRVMFGSHRYRWCKSDGMENMANVMKSDIECIYIIATSTSYKYWSWFSGSGPFPWIHVSRHLSESNQRKCSIRCSIHLKFEYQQMLLTIKCCAPPRKPSSNQYKWQHFNLCSILLI